MKTQTKKKSANKVARFGLVLGSAGLMLGATSLRAQDVNLRGFYMATDAGVNLADNLVLPGANGGSISSGTGIRWDVSMGYDFKLSDQLSLAPEMEVGLMYNPLDTATPTGGGSTPISGQYLQVPVLANGILNWNFSPHWVAYGGVGAGLDYGVLNITGIGGNNVGNLTGGEADFAWQGMVGIRYAFGSSEVGLGYKYLSVKPNGVDTVGNSAIMVSYTCHF
jgi:hypothetical protein